jgi:hypothetical protein
MKIWCSADSLETASNNPAKRFPTRKEAGAPIGILTPRITPKFLLTGAEVAFTMGSCFARNIEEWLVEENIKVPTTDFAVPKSEWPYRPNGPLNEFNAGTIAQRILWALQEKTAPVGTVIGDGDSYDDLLLPGGCNPVSYERCLARRAEIDQVYKKLRSSDFVVITLGLVEAWHDDMLDVYLNQMPPISRQRAEPTRYSLRQLDVDDVVDLLRPALVQLSVQAGLRVILTVSPVPLQTTFTNADVIAANCYSKCVLRVAAQRLSDALKNVDYFPSYEMVASRGQDSFGLDNVHVKDEVVSHVVKHMVTAYFGKSNL